MRRLQIRWMIEGPGGYDERRLSLPIPSLITLLMLATLVWYAWDFGKVFRHGR